MEIKKNSKKNLENYRGIFFQIGLILSLSLVLFAFEKSTNNNKVKTLGDLAKVDVEEEFVIITKPKEEPPPPKQEKKAIEILKIVSDETDIKEEIKVDESESNEKTEIKIVEPLPEEPEEDNVIFGAEIMPEFPGGIQALRCFVAENIKYPNTPRELNIQGTVHVQFVVMKDGTVDQVKILRGIDPELDDEAMRVIRSLPKWKPGVQAGKLVNVAYSFPINFKIR